ncbi:hypothetical protein HOC13_03915 [Candidatus Woesearchaeota archaeon]|jgi:hypothetical protein|nr:hypothetical protein [Candidatus Woesearchaeota archaeon]
MWNTIYTDGKIFATNDFMSLYNNHAGYLNEERFQRAAKIAQLDLIESKITKVESNKDPGFSDYYLSGPNNLGHAIATLSDSLVHPVMSALRVSDVNNLEGTVVQAFYQSNHLRGFRALPKEQ